MRKKLTTKTIDAMPPAKGKRYEVRDTLVTGLHIRVSATGGKVWYLATRVEGRMRRIKLGAYPVISLSDARQHAQALATALELSIPPHSSARSCYPKWHPAPYGSRCHIAL